LPNNPFSKHNHANSCVYEYDDNGRLVSAVTSSGDHFSLVADLDLRGAIVNVSLNGREDVVSLLMQPTHVQQLVGGGDDDNVKMDSDKSFVVESRWGRRVRIRCLFDKSPLRYFKRAFL
jgi:hypothetical protein